MSRKTVRKVIRSEETEFTYERSSQPQPKIGPWRDELDSLLATNAARPSRDRLTLIRIFEELRGLGYEGSYDAVRRYTSTWKRRESEATAAAYVPLSFSLPVRLEPRDRRHGRRDHDREGGPCPALP